MDAPSFDELVVCLVYFNHDTFILNHTVAHQRNIHKYFRNEKRS